ncbi:hypothetical protein ACTOB_005434 [Actinoplanes oblitus]|uniref:Gram-positive cocci surface proteins LPxTG domain-containing protein n=1 Tax=Actinoplanes oblitus TaxID=3040509 RepID=A0ABY8W967_9ACTN|nr:hypothetical protein [Actinoplanes oblitus]WIM93455.1 hypothetical protein ACTOB_005434 [Actinoplanes oblitus]
MRYLGRLAGAAMAAGALLAGPAWAGGSRQGGPVSAGFPDIQVPVGGVAVDPLGPSLWSTVGPTTLSGVRVSYDLRGVAGVRLTPSRDGGGECDQPSPTRVVCSDPRVLSFEGETIEQYLPVVVGASRAARPGSSGTVRIRFAADGVAPIVGSSEVQVVDGRGNLPVTGPAWSGGIGLLLLGVGAVLAAGRRTRSVAGL